MCVGGHSPHPWADFFLGGGVVLLTLSPLARICSSLYVLIVTYVTTHVTVCVICYTK